jgi:SAM-dependent methyltransferase
MPKPKSKKNSEILAAFWARFIDWEARWEGPTGRFILEQLRGHNCRKVFDAALGDGCDTINLLRTGEFDVRANEIDEAWREKAMETAAAENHPLDGKVTDHKWQLDNFPELVGNGFDCVLCLGNSLTYLENESDRLKALQNFRELLRPGGILLIDERNYQPLLDKRKEVNKQKMPNSHVKDRFKFKYSGEYVYCGKEVHGFPCLSQQRYRIQIPR